MLNLKPVEVKCSMSDTVFHGYQRVGDHQFGHKPVYFSKTEVHKLVEEFDGLYVPEYDACMFGLAASKEDLLLEDKDVEVYMPYLFLLNGQLTKLWFFSGPGWVFVEAKHGDE